MSDILHYILDMIPYMIISIPIIIIVRFINFKKQKKINWNREVAIFIFALFMVGLGSQTIIPKLEFGMDGGISIVQLGKNEINIIPFKVIYDTYVEVIKNDYINYFLINFLGNIVIFIPIGFFIPLLWKIDNKKSVYQKTVAFKNHRHFRFFI